MSVDVDVSSNGVRAPLSRQRVQEVVEAVLKSEKIRNALVSITFLDKRAMAQLNKKHLRHVGPTDVISFGFSRATTSDPVVGDIYVCPEVASANAKGRGEPIRREITRLVAHGTLHILGYDHPHEDREESDMWRKQERVVARVTASPRKRSSRRSARQDDSP